MRHRAAQFIKAVMVAALLTAAAYQPTRAATEPATLAADEVAKPSPERIRALIDTLKDEGARADLIARLDTLLAVEAAREKAGEEEIPSTIGSRLLSGAARRLETVRGKVGGFVASMANLPAAAAWVAEQAVDPVARERWSMFIIQFVLILAAGGLAGGAAERLLVRPRRALVERAPRGLAYRLPLIGLRTLLRLVPVAAFVAAAFAVLGTTDLPRVRLAALAVVNASILARLADIVVGVFLDPEAGTLRLLPLRIGTARVVVRWTRRFTLVGVYGYFLIEAAFVLGLPLAAYGVMMQLLGLVLTIMIIRLILRFQDIVARWIRVTPLLGRPSESREGEETPPRISESPTVAALGDLRRRLADVWHIALIVYILAVFAVWSFNVYGGFEYLARATLVTIVVFAIARFAADWALVAAGRGFGRAGAKISRLPALAERAQRYRPMTTRAIKLGVWVVAAALILDAWGVDVMAWLESSFGRRVIGGGVTILVVLILAVIAWETVSVLIEVTLTGVDAKGRGRHRSARARTLLPLFRNAFLVVLVTVVSLITLSELGVNIAPLLAGAGVVGVAVGFGSQTLVKDVITGLFILFEDTISVGDVVDVGGGHSGVVEAMSIRTIRLRDYSGAVHSIPFSAVNTVTNMTKDFSYAVFDVQVAYAENPDRVSEVMSAIAEEMRADPAWKREILAPLEIAGLDKLADSGIVIKARLKTKPSQQWAVGREYNRRIFLRFAELGISIPFPHMQLVMQPSPVAESGAEI